MTASRRLRSSVIVVTYNHCAVVPTCLRSLTATIGTDDEVIVVDNASTDGTAQMVAKRYPKFRVLVAPENVGFGRACNIGAAVARGQHLVFLNPDTEARSGWLDALLAGLRAEPGVGLVTAKLLLAKTPERIDTFGNEVHVSGITTSRGWGEPAEWYVNPQAVTAISGACFALRRELFEQLDGFDERLFLYYEDTDLSLRARLAGARCVAVPDAEVLHDHVPGFRPDKLRYLERNRWWTLLKLYRARTLVCLTPVLLMGEVLAWGMALHSGPKHVRAKALAWLDLIAWLGDLPAARARVRKVRLISDGELLRTHGARLRFSQVAQGMLAQLGERFAALMFKGGRAVAIALSGD